MKLLPKTRKGQGLGDLPGYIQMFVIAGIFLGVGALVLSEFADSLDAETNDDNNTIAAINSSIDGILEMATFLPINN